MTDQIWMLHRNCKSYTGAFPEGFISRLNQLLQIKEHHKVFHVFGGFMQDGYNCDTNDINPDIPATYHFDVRKPFPIEDNIYDIVICDPPYDCPVYDIGFIHTSDKKKRVHYGKNLYGTDFVPPYSFIDEVVRITKLGGYICVLHFLVYKIPKDCERYTVIPIISGPNLRIRALNIFKKSITLFNN